MDDWKHNQVGRITYPSFHTHHLYGKNYSFVIWTLAYLHLIVHYLLLKWMSIFDVFHKA